MGGLYFHGDGVDQVSARAGAGTGPWTFSRVQRLPQGRIPAAMLDGWKVRKLFVHQMVQASGIPGSGQCSSAQDLPKAVEKYKEAANGGLLLAKFNLAGCYFHGNGAEKDQEKAVRLWSEAAKEGTPFRQGARSCPE